MTPIRKGLGRLLQIEQGEAATFSLLSLALFLSIGGYYVIGRTVSRSLFLSNLPPELIPVRYIAVTIGIVIFSLIYTNFSARFRRDHLIIGSTALMAAGVLLFRGLLATPLGSSLLILGSLFVFLEVSATLTIIQFWTYASELLNSREAKRLFGPISSMGSLGGILAGAFVTLAATTVGAANLLFVLLLTQLGFISCAWILGRRHQDTLIAAPRKAAPRSESKPSISKGFREIWATPLLLSMAGIGIVTSMVSNIAEYQFDLTLQSSFTGNEAGMAQFLGSFYFWAGVIGFIFQLLASGRLLRFFGISVSLLILPLSFAFGSTLVLATGAAMWAVTVTRASEPIFRYNLNDTALSLLDLPLGRDIRARTKAVISGILKPLTIGAAGLLFLLVGNLRGISPLPWSYLVLLLVAIWVLLIRRVRHQYRATLSTSIVRRRFDPALEAININDETTKKIIFDALQQKDEAQVLQALSLVKEAPQVDWSAALIPLLEHPLKTIRLEALKRMGSPLYHAHAPLVLEQVSDPDGAVSAAAINAYCAILGSEANREISPYLDHEDPVVRGAAVTGIIVYGGLNGILQAALALKSMLDDPDPLMRCAGADALAQLEVKSFYQPLFQLLQDEDKLVRNRALYAAGKLGHPDLLPGVIALLGAPETKAAATQALLAYGEGCCPAMGQFLQDRETNILVRRQIPKVLGRIASPDSARILLRQLNEEDDHTRARVYKALVRLQARGVAMTIDEEMLAARLHEELRIAYDTAVTRIDLAQHIRGSLLAEALSIQQTFALDRVFYLLGLLYPASNMAEIHFSVTSGDARQKANATELLDTTIARPVKSLLLPLLEGPQEHLLQVAAEEFGLQRFTPLERAMQLASSTDEWITACTINTFSRANWPQLHAVIDQCLVSDSGLLRETAIAAACLCYPQDKFMDILQSQAADSTFPAVSHFAQRGLAEIKSSQEKGEPIMPLSTVERVIFLRGADLFRDISGEDLVLIAQVCHEVFFPAGQLIIRQGDIGDTLFIIVDGTVVIEIEGHGEIDRMGAKEVVGEMAIISRNPRSANCRAITDLTALRIDFDDFWDLLAEKPGLSLGVIRVLSSRLSDRIRDLAEYKLTSEPAQVLP